MFTAVKKRIPDGRRADAESFHTDNAIVTSVVDHMPIDKNILWEESLTVTDVTVKQKQQNT